jgi:hypothetical protein
VADDRLDRRPAFHLTFDGRRNAPALAGQEHTQRFRRGMATIALVGMEALHRDAEALFEPLDDASERMSVIRVANGQRRQCDP